jgi:hypothetical protein
MTDNELQKRALQVATELCVPDCYITRVINAYILGYCEAKEEVLKELETLVSNKEKKS